VNTLTLIFLGTSNCIVSQSFVDAAREISNEAVINASVGASPSRSGLYMMEGVDFNKGDVVFLDYTVTDGYYLPFNEHCDGLPYYPVSEQTIQLDILSIIDRLYRAEALPILMINPSKAGLGGHLDLESVHTSICRKTGVPVFHVSDLLRLVVQKGGDVERLMRDDTHTAPAVTAILGRALVDVVDEVRALGRTVDLNGKRIFKSRTVMAAPMVEPERRLIFSSRLRASEMAWLRTGDVLHFDVGQDEQLLGLMVNMAGPGAKVRLRSSVGEEIRDLIYNWENDNPQVYMSIFVSMREPLFGGIDGVALEILSQDGPWTPSDNFRPPILDRTYDNLPVEGLLVGQLEAAYFADYPPPRVP
jgi:hypothetical protein